MDDPGSFEVVQIEDEIQFLQENLPYLVEPDQVIRNYFKARKRLYFFLFLNFVLEAVLTILVVKTVVFAH